MATLAKPFSNEDLVDSVIECLIRLGGEAVPTRTNDMAEILAAINSRLG